MILVLLLLFILCLWGLRFCKVNPDYITIQGTNAVKGVLAVVILCSHMGSYLVLDNSVANRGYSWLMTYLGQSMVAPYFFYSGYGIFQSFKKKAGYVSGFFKRRWLKILVHFDLAVLLYIIVQFILSIFYPIHNYIWCWIGWESVGNSNWFIFVILSLYLIAYSGLLLDKDNNVGGRVLIVTVTILSAVLWLLLRFVAHKETWWIDTISTFPLGMLFAIYRDKVETLLKDRDLQWSFAFVCMASLYVLWHHWRGVDVFGICSCLFCLVLVLLTMKVKIGNPILTFLGRNAFSIYILQRLPMLVFSHFGLNLYPELFIPLSIVTVLLLSEAFTRLTDIIDRRFFYAG